MNGPFETELFDEIGDEICKRGNEFGSTTGRKRRCGWLNLDEIKYHSVICGVDEFVMTKSDVLSGFEEVRVFVNGEYNLMSGWETTDSDEFWKFADFIEKSTGIKVSIISCGVGRNDLILR